MRLSLLPSLAVCVVWAACFASFAPERAFAQTPVSPSTTIAEKNLKFFDADHLKRLLQWAAQLTGREYPLAIDVPPVQATSADALGRTVCPDAPHTCARVAAAYDVGEGRIIHLETFDARRVLDRSFIVHEMVHFLQHLEQGVELNATCHVIRANEAEAYRAQFAYLRRYGRHIPQRLRIPRVRCPRPMEASVKPKTETARQETGPVLKAQIVTR
ncbi:MAG: hypothetical protein AB8C46_00015 [Burkholderiaceae bacterium]